MTRTRLLMCLIAMAGLLCAASLFAKDAPPPGPGPRADAGPPPRDPSPPRDAQRGPRDGAADEPAPPPGPRDPAGPERRRPPREGDFDRPPGGPDGPLGPGRRRPLREGGFDQPQPPPSRDQAGPGGPGRHHPAGPPLEGRPGPEGRGPEGRGGMSGRPGPEGARPSGPPRWPHQDWNAMERTDPEMFRLLREDAELEQHTRQLALQLRQAPPDKREEAKKHLVESVSKQFEIRNQRRMLDLKRLEGELTKLRESIERRMKARAEIIERRIVELTGGESDLSF